MSGGKPFFLVSRGRQSTGRNNHWFAESLVNESMLCQHCRVKKGTPIHKVLELEISAPDCIIAIDCTETQFNLCNNVRTLRPLGLAILSIFSTSMTLRRCAAWQGCAATTVDWWRVNLLVASLESDITRELAAKL